METFFKTKIDAKVISWAGIGHEERQFKADSGAPMHLMSKSDSTLEEQDTVPQSEESCMII